MPIKGEPLRRLSQEDKAVIRQMVLSGNSDEAIASHFNVCVKTIKRQRKKMNLRKRTNGNLIEGELDPVKEKVRKLKNTAPTGNKSIAYRTALRVSPRYIKLQKQFTKEDLEQFVEHWVAYHLQLEDMTPAEEDLLETLLTFKMRLSENQKDFHDIQKMEQNMMSLLGNDVNKEMDLENEDQRQLYDMILSISRRKLDINKEYKELHSQYEKVHQSLNVTRAQREAKNKIGSDTFLSLVRLLKEEENREVIGRHNEWVRLSTDKKIEQLKQPHTFADGETEPILLDGSAFSSEDDPEDSEQEEDSKEE